MQTYEIIYQMKVFETVARPGSWSPIDWLIDQDHHLELNLGDCANQFQCFRFLVAIVVL